MSTMKNICVFCGSRPGNDPLFMRAATNMGTALARAGKRLIYGGGNIGLMGALADAALAAGGEVIGVIPQALLAKEVAHANLTALHVVSDMHTRKAMMADLSDAFIALPGGIGTMEELFEVWTWGQLGLHTKPCGLLEVENYYAPLLTMLDGMVAHGLLRQTHRDMLIVGGDPAALITAIATAHPVRQAAWIGPDQT
ncbi:MAG TPA: TIGR00730 family Rossman fold protein [Rhodocyclaceae bacterium]|nr:TIGR00730 family Rossman fold protein [Rhodocyclaceae bacterium]